MNDPKTSKFLSYKSFEVTTRVVTLSASTNAIKIWNEEFLVSFVVFVSQMTKVLKIKPLNGPMMQIRRKKQNKKTGIFRASLSIHLHLHQLEILAFIAKEWTSKFPSLRVKFVTTHHSEITINSPTSNNHTDAERATRSRHGAPWKLAAIIYLYHICL